MDLKSELGLYHDESIIFINETLHIYIHIDRYIYTTGCLFAIISATIE